MAGLCVCGEESLPFLMVWLIVVVKATGCNKQDDAMAFSLQLFTDVLTLVSVLGPKRKKKQSVFDEELTNTSRKALKQYRAG